VEWSRENGSCIYTVFSGFLSSMETRVLYECAFLVPVVSHVFLGD
jgi:hypothetical protein